MPTIIAPIIVVKRENLKVKLNDNNRNKKQFKVEVPHSMIMTVTYPFFPLSSTLTGLIPPPKNFPRSDSISRDIMF